MDEKTLSIESYVQEISYWLPYPEQRKRKILERLKVEIMEAVQDTGESDPVVAFGDPYQVAKDLSSGQDWDTERASYADRVIAYLVDVFIQAIGIMLGTIIWVMAVIGPYLFTGDQDLSRSQIPAVLLTLFFILIPYVLLWEWGYFILFEKVLSRTPGKALLGLTVCDESGVRLTWSQAIMRNLSKLQSSILLVEVIIGIAQENDFQRPLDIVAKTIVIRKRFRKPQTS
ncbi:MAG: RDD family protein [Candidatus Odinarchaeota archaeon]